MPATVLPKNSKPAPPPATAPAKKKAPDVAGEPQEPTAEERARRFTWEEGDLQVVGHLNPDEMADLLRSILGEEDEEGEEGEEGEDEDK